jgi:hypothetical protein
VEILVGKLQKITYGRRRGYKEFKEAELLYSKFTIQVSKIFNNLPKHLEWISFYDYGLPILMDIYEEVREASNQNQLNQAQTRALSDSSPI